MKKSILLMSVIVASVNCYAQIPTTNPQPVQLPVPVVKQLKKAPDLSVSIIKIVGADWHNNLLEVKVTVKIYNNSDVAVNNVMVGADVEHPALPALEHSYFHPFTTTETIARIAPRSSVLKTIVFTKEEVPANPDRRYRFRIEVDPRYMIDEMDETNNRSAVVEINY